MFRANRTCIQQMDVSTDGERFEALFCKHYGRVLAYARRRTTPEGAQDVVSETFLVAWRRLDNIPRDELAWLLAVARRSLANGRRATRRHDALVERLAAEPSERLEHEATEPRELIAALATLSALDRELLILIAWDGVTPAEAAVTLGCSAASARVRLHRARRRLAIALAESGDSEVVRRKTASTPRLKETT